MFKLKKYEDRLMAALNFSEFDLENNRVGLMTYHQMRNLRDRRVGAALSWALPMLLSISGLSLWYMVALGAQNVPVEVVFLPLLFVLALSGWLFAYFGMRSSRLGDDLEENLVSVMEGRVDLSVVTGRNSAAYSLQIDGLRFPLDRAAFLAFKNGDPYRIYFAPHSKHILSVEWLRDQEDDDPFEPLVLIDADQPEKRKAA